MKRLLSFLRPHKRLFCCLLVLNFALAGISVLTPLLTKQIVDRVLLGGAYGLMPRFIAAVLGVALARAAGMFLYQYGKEILGQRILTTVRTAMYRQFLVLPYSFYDTAQTGQLMSRITHDVDAARLFLANSLIEVINLGVTIVWVYVSLSMQNPTLAWLCLLPLVAIGLAMHRMQRRLAPIWTEVHQRNAELSSVLQENLAGYRVVKAFAREEDEEERFRRVNEENRRINMKIARMWTSMQSAMSFTNRGIQLGVLGIGGYLAITDRITPGTLVASLSLVRMLIGPIVQLSNQANVFSQSLAGGLRVFEILDEPRPIRSPKDPVPLPEVRGEITIEDVTFAYRGTHKHALHGVSLHIPAGTSLGLVGETGSGKSTLINLLGRFYDPDQGRVLLDGVDLRRLDLELLRRNLGFVSQEPLLFSATIKENIAFGNPDAPLEAIIEAAKLAQAHDFIMEMPYGYETKLGERGAGLSGGQKQRLAIARAFLTNPRLLVLDDCTSAVDAETEVRLKEAIDLVMRGRTTIIVANRISAVQNADRIVVLREGRVVEEGTHAELLAARGFYWRSYRLQTRRECEPAAEEAAR
ncbi:MAG: ABC transporter ATP-binding protein [Bacteroidota bacterium]